MNSSSAWSPTPLPADWLADCWNKWHPARLSPAGLAWWTGLPSWQLAPHLALLNHQLLEIAGRRQNRLIVTMPPRHGKSLLVSQYFPAWYLGTYPDRRVILTSYGGEFAAMWGGKVRDLMQEFGPTLFGVRLCPNRRASDYFEIADHCGAMFTAGTGGSITGKGADLLIIDDPIKNHEQATSQLYRDKIWDWFQSTAYTRLEPQGAVVVVQTRWHQDDLAGRLLAGVVEGTDEASPPDRWEQINLPALAEEGDLLGRRPGRALWPKRFSRATLERKRRMLGNYWFSAIYQQRPVPAQGSIFSEKWFRYFEEKDGFYLLESTAIAINECTRFLTVDLAISEKQQADYTVIAAWAVTLKGDLLLLDLRRQRLAALGSINAIKQLLRRWGAEYAAIEKTGFQQAIIDQLKQDGIPVRGVSAKGDKVSRARSAAIRFEAGKVYFSAKARWLATLEQELKDFPKSKHDDQVDAISYGCLEMTRHGLGLADLDHPFEGANE